MTLRHRSMVATLGASTALTFAALFAFAGCSSTSGDCASLCVDNLRCDKSNASTPDATLEKACAGFCSQESNVADDSGCSAEFSDYIACIGSAPDICKVGESCTASSDGPSKCTGPCVKESDALEACSKPFCSQASHQAECNIEGGADGSGSGPAD